MTTSRRSFLKLGVGLSVPTLAPALLPGCASVDRFFLGDKRILDNEVLIVGGGLSGLVAAFELKKSKIPYRLVEAKSALGGRIQTLNSLGDVPASIEIGADYFTDYYVETISLLKELQIEKNRIVVGNQKNYYQFENRFYSVQEIQKQIVPINNHILKIRQSMMNQLNASVEVVRQDDWRILSQEPALDFLSRIPVNISLTGLAFLEDTGYLEFGVGLKQISALQLILRWHQMQKLIQPSTALYQVQGGNQELIRALYRRVAGVIPDYLVRSPYELKEIKDRGFIFECFFQTQNGIETLFAKNIIFTLPTASYSKIKGLNDLDLSVERKSSFEERRMGAHSKLLVAIESMADLPNSFVTSKGQGRWVHNNLHGKTMSDKIRVQVLASEEALRAGEEQMQEFCRDLGKWSNSEKKPVFRDEKYVVNWGQKPEFLGSKSYLSSSDIAKLYPRILESESDGKIFFAGESQNLAWTGSMEGAIISAKRATRYFSQRLKLGSV